MDKEFSDAMLTGIGMLLGAGVPIVTIMFVKDFLNNLVAGMQIKLNSNYQYINSFGYEGRKKCRVSNIHFTTVELQDMESDQFITIFNKDFIRAKVWRNIERSKIDT